MGQPRLHVSRAVINDHDGLIGHMDRDKFMVLHVQSSKFGAVASRSPPKRRKGIEMNIGVVLLKKFETTNDLEDLQ